MFSVGIIVGLGIDGICVLSFNLWVIYYWVVSGKIVGGFDLGIEYVDRLIVFNLFI